MPETPALSLVVPLRDEAGNVDALVEEIATVLGPVCPHYELILVDDGSTDGTWERVRRLQAADPARVVAVYRTAALPQEPRDAALALLIGRYLATARPGVTLAQSLICAVLGIAIVFAAPQAMRSSSSHAAEVWKVWKRCSPPRNVWAFPFWLDVAGHQYEFVRQGAAAS